MLRSPWSCTSSRRSLLAVKVRKRAFTRFTAGRSSSHKIFAKQIFCGSPEKRSLRDSVGSRPNPHHSTHSLVRGGGYECTYRRICRLRACVPCSRTTLYARFGHARLLPKSATLLRSQKEGGCPIDAFRAETDFYSQQRLYKTFRYLRRRKKIK